MRPSMCYIYPCKRVVGDLYEKTRSMGGSAYIARTHMINASHWRDNFITTTALESDHMVIID
jgi:hypothetical protein